MTRLHKLTFQATLVIALTWANLGQAVSLLPYGQDVERDKDNLDGSWMVCGLANAQSSYLSVRQQPSAQAAEIIKLNSFAIVYSKGVLSADKKWIEIYKGYQDLLADGTILTDDDMARFSMRGWISVNYICHYGPYNVMDPA